MDNSAALAPLAAELTQLQTREALVERLTRAFAEHSADESIALVADLLWLLKQDRQQLAQRVAALLDRRSAGRSERSSEAQIALFREVIEQLARDEAAKDPVAGAAPTEGDGAERAPAPPSAAEVQALLNETNREIEQAKQVLAAQRAAALREARAQRERAREGLDPEAVPWPDHLPVEVRREEPLEEHLTCGDCHQPRVVVRYVKAWVIERRVQTSVVVTETPVLACASHHGAPVQAPAPPRPVPTGRLGFSLAAEILYLRIVQNLPVRRIVEMLASEGVPVTEEVAHTVIARAGDSVKPVYAALHRAVQEAALVNLDDTPVAVHLGLSPRKRTTARVWLALGDNAFAYFFPTRSWAASEAKERLGPLVGTLQGDGYAGFAAYAAEQGVKLAGCMDHLRRKLLKAQKAGDPRATYPLILVQGLYRVEQLARLTDATPERILELREQRSVPLYRALLAWRVDVQPTIVTGSPLGKAWTYLENQQEALSTYLSDAIVAISNAAAERGLRRITIGRKLWLFHRGYESLEHVTRLLSVAYTARLAAVDERAYLEWLLRRLADREWSDSAATALLPAAFKAQQARK